MKRTALIAILALSACTSRTGGQIDSALLERLRTSLPIAESPSPVPPIDTAMTIRVPSKGITDQQDAGLCWYYSTTNILRAEVMSREGWDDFYFSHTFGQFYDLLEKCNSCLENMAAHRDEPIDSRYNYWLFGKPFGDGGHFSNAAHLIDKYGIVPSEAMRPTSFTTQNLALMKALRRLCRKAGLKLREGGDVQEIKEAALRDVYALLVATLGAPPETFQFEGETYTPISFRDRFVPHNMEEDYLIFMNDPTLEYMKLYRVEDSRNCIEYAPWTFLNVPMETINSLGITSLRNGKMFYISADTAQQGLAEEGVYDLAVAGLDTLAGIDLGMSKADMIRSIESTSLHAMAVAGVRLDGDKPLAWLIENSFGLSRGLDGYVTMSSSWMDKYLFRLAVEKQFVPSDLLPLFGSKPISLPAWHQGY